MPRHALDPRRWSLRLRVTGAIILVALAPQALVYGWSLLAHGSYGRARTRALAATDAAAAVLQRTSLEPARSELAVIATRHRVRLRVLESRIAPSFEAQADDPTAPFSRIEAFFLGSQDETDLNALYDPAGPLDRQTAVREALRAGQFADCRMVGLVFCESLRKVTDASGRALLVYVQSSSHRAIDAVDELRGQLGRIALVTVPLALLLALYTGWRLVRPIDELRRQALAKAAAASPRGALEADPDDEIGALADAFNRLVAALEQKRSENEAFVADLVHEFKNPVAAVRASADALGKGAYDAERAARLERVLRESSAKLDQLVTQVLELARAEAGMPNEERTSVDLAALTEALVARARDDARFAHLSFAFEGPPTAIVTGVAHRLDALVRELLENGASFARESVRVAVSESGSDVVVTVQDDGPGILEDDLPRVFRRFFTTRGERRGTGLGLSLVHAVAQAHGGSASARSLPGRGATLEVRLPRAT